jgi:mRNA interferase HigB
MLIIRRFHYLLFYFENQNLLIIFALLIMVMRIFTEQLLKEYAEKHPESKIALQDWVSTVKKSNWECFADIKKTYNSVDSFGNQRYVFNIKGNNYRLIVVIKFTIKFVYIRFIGTHKEYDKIDCLTI